MAKTFFQHSEISNEVVNRSILLFHEYHGLYEDDYEGLLFYDPVEKKFGYEGWTTAGACTYLPHKTHEFGYNIEKLLSTGEHSDWVEEIKSALREDIANDKRRDEYFANGSWANYLSSNTLAKYSYQKEAAEAVTNELYCRWNELWSTVENFWILLYYTKEATAGSYKNDKDSIEYKLKGVKCSVPGMFIPLLENKLVPRHKKEVKFTGDRYVGEVISKRREHNTYGYRSDWHWDVTFGMKVEGMEKTVWFKMRESKLTDRMERGSKIEVYGRLKAEYERSININYVKVKSINNVEVEY